MSKNNQHFCSRAFHKFVGLTLTDFATLVKNGITGSPKIFDPLIAPVTLILWEQYIKEAADAYANWKAGGIAQKIIYQGKHDILMKALNDSADFVDKIANNNVDTITLSGFIPTNVKPVSLMAVELFGQPINVEVFTGVSTGKLDSNCEPFGINAVYGCIVSEGKPLPDGIDINDAGQLILPAGITNRIIFDFNTNRMKSFSGLTKGVDYYFYWFIMTTHGVSALSIAVSRMSL